MANKNLKEKLIEDMKMAMKDKDKVRLSVIRMIRAGIQSVEMDSGKQLEDEELIDVIAKELKQRKETLSEWKKTGRQNMVDQVEKEIAIIQDYLPEQLSEEEVKDIAMKAIQETGADGPADMGKVMGRVISKTKGRADGSMVSKVVQNLLSNM